MGSVYNLPTISACAAVFVILTGTASAKDCVQLVGGACQGHWACTTADGSSGFCDDPPGIDCYCKKGKRSRTRRKVTEDSPAYMEHYNSPATTPAHAHHDTEGPPQGPLAAGKSDNRKPPKLPDDSAPNTPQQ
jgi:hypothetical protein